MKTTRDIEWRIKGGGEIVLDTHLLLHLKLFARRKKGKKGKKVSIALGRKENKDRGEGCCDWGRD